MVDIRQHLLACQERVDGRQQKLACHAEIDGRQLDAIMGTGGAFHAEE